jgi:hypothetical protein
MSASAHRYPLVIFLVVFGITSQYVSAVAQELERGEGRRARSTRSVGRPSVLNQQIRQPLTLAQFGGGRGDQPHADEPPSDKPRDMIAITVWVFTVKHAVAPEDEEPVGSLLDRAVALPTVVGTVEEVRDLVGRLKAAGLLEQLSEFRLSSLDGQSGTLQNGANEPRIVATNVDPVAGQSNSLNVQAVGSVLKVLPRITSANDIELSVEYNSSDIEKSNEIVIYKPVKGEPMFADLVVTNQITSSVRLKSGTAILFSSATSFEEADNTHARTQLAIVSASVLPALDAPHDAAETHAHSSGPEPALAVPEPAIAIEVDN